MIILVGNKLRLGGLAEVISTRLNEEFSFLEENINILNQENEILSFGKDISYIIYDATQYYNEAEELIEVIKSIYRVNKAKVILYVNTDNPKNDIIKSAIARQIKNFINANRQLGEQKDQLEKIISGYYDVNPREDVIEAEKEYIRQTKTLNEFVGELYDAKKREIAKEKTVIINKKRRSEVIISTLTAILKTVFTIISVILMSIAILCLIYTEPREAFFKVIANIYNEILEMIL